VAERIVIRLASAEDAPAMAAIYAPFVEADATSFETEAPSPSEMRKRIAETTVAYPWLVCDCDGVVAGYAYATRHRVRAAYQWCVETSVYVQTDFRRTGVARGLYTSLLAVLAEQGFVNAYAGITLPNARSVALHEAVGFLPLGIYRGIGYKLGAWHDVGWWHQVIRRHPETPEPPKSIAEVQRSPEWDALLSAGLSLVRSQGLPDQGS
jgi:phosphinothricin acetyltransferase